MVQDLEVQVNLSIDARWYGIDACQVESRVGWYNVGEYTYIFYIAIGNAGAFWINNCQSYHLANWEFYI